MVFDRLQSALGGRYDLDPTPVGEGGMATVYRAHDLKHDRHVAIKVLKPELAARIGRERFLAEIRTTAQLHHPNLAQLYDSGDADGLLYFVMPFYEGDTLERRLLSRGQLERGEALEIARDLAAALACAHEQGVIHRDVKPSNVFLEGGQAILADFGIAKEESRTHGTGDQSLGTAEYMSPEQLSGKEVDGRSDLYGLGCVLFEMLAGEVPFSGDTMQVVAQHVGGVRPDVGKRRKGLPWGLRHIVLKCMAKDRKDRYPTAAHLKLVLDRAIHGEWESNIWWRRVRRRTRSAATTVAALVLGLFIVFRATEAPALSPRRIVVFPVADRGGGVPDQTNISLLLGNTLLCVDPLGWIDGWDLLSPELRGDPKLLTYKTAKSLASDRGARYFVMGGSTTSGGRVALSLRLYDVLGDSLLHQSAVDGPADQSTTQQLAYQAVVELLPPILAPGRQADVSYMQERNPGAVGLWIKGEEAYREARFTQALDLYRRAVEIDSLLVWAALKGVQAARWVPEDSTTAAELLPFATRHDSLFPPRYRHFAAGFDAYARGDGQEAVSAFRAALGEDDKWAEAWTYLGEVYRHLLTPDFGGEDSATAAFTRALEVDEDFLVPLVHTAEVSLRARELRRASELLEVLYTARGPGPEGFPWLDLMEACAEQQARGTPGFPASAEVPDIMNAAMYYATGARNLECAELGFRRILDLARVDPEAVRRNHRWAALLGLQGLLSAAGRFEELNALFDEWLPAESSLNYLFALNVFAGAPIEERARSIYQRDIVRWGPDFATIGPRTTWILAVWATHQADLPTLESLGARLEHLRDSLGTASVERLLTGVRGYRAITVGDTSSALSILSSILPVADPMDLRTGLPEPLAVERLLQAEILLARGESQRAYEVASVFDHPEPLIFIPFLPRSLLIRLAAAQSLSGPEWADRAREAESRLLDLGRADLIPARSRGGSR